MFGTHGAADLLAVTNQSVAEFGEDKVSQMVQDEMEAHNTLVESSLSELASFGTEQISGYGKTTDIEALEVEEFGTVDAQKTGPPTNQGWPLKAWQVVLQWTRLYLTMVTPAELALEINAAKTADLKKIQREIRNAFYNSANNLTYIDKRSKNQAVLPLRALLNADSTAIPAGPNGEVFAGASHTHYLATASMIAANVSALVETVIEHKTDGQVRLYINRAQEAAIRGFTGNFTPYYDARITPSISSAVANGELDSTNLYSRAIGMYDGAEVWVKPWVSSTYLIAARVGGSGKVLRVRTRTGSMTGLGAFELRFENEQYPLRSHLMEREIGIGIDDRAGGAVLYTGAGSYAVPAYG